MSNLKLNISYKHHLICAVILGIWLAAFLVLIAPFDVADVPFNTRLIEMPFYGVIAIACYMVIIPIQNKVYAHFQRWNLGLEIALYIVLSLVMLVGCFLYYQSWVINGDYPLPKFTFEVYYPIFFIVLPIMIFVRWYLNKKPAPHTPKKIILAGEYKHDVLQLTFSELISISSADNYVEIVFLRGNEIDKKLLRLTLKQAHEQAPELLKIHRSHIINPEHFIAWKDNHSLLLTGIELPVSKSYKQQLILDKDSPLNPNNLSLND